MNIYNTEYNALYLFMYLSVYISLSFTYRKDRIRYILSK